MHHCCGFCLVKINFFFFKGGPLEFDFSKGRDLSLHCHLLAGCGAHSAFGFICVVKKPEDQADRLPPGSDEVKAI